MEQLIGKGRDEVTRSIWLGTEGYDPVFAGDVVGPLISIILCPIARDEDL